MPQTLGETACTSLRFLMFFLMQNPKGVVILLPSRLVVCSQTFELVLLRMRLGCRPWL